MANCLDTITRAMRRIGITAAGELPRDQEREDAFEALKALYRRLINDGALGVIKDTCPITQALTAIPGQRIIASLATVTLPDTAPDCSVICVVDPTTNQVDEYIFDGRIQKWASIDDLDLTSEAPLSHRDPLGLSCALALELADEYGQTASEMTVRNAARWQIGLTHNWSVEPETQRGVYF